MPKALIYGSCVARDTMTVFPEDWEKPTYIARQSMISAATGRAPVSTDNALESAFQNRALKNDIEGIALRRIKAKAQEHDVILLDLVDERRGVYEVADGKYVTRSYELMHSKILDHQETPPRHINFGTREHLKLWKPAARKIVRVIEATGVPAFLLAPPWASKSNEGNEITWGKQLVPAMNKRYEPYVQHLKDLGIPLITVPESEALGDEHHKWSVAAFHYVEDVYTTMRDKILAQLS